MSKSLAVENLSDDQLIAEVMSLSSDLLSDSLLWWSQNKLTTEKGLPLEFKDRGYLKEIYGCGAKKMIIKKSAQCGVSSFALNKCLYLADTRDVAIIYIMPTAGDVSIFSQSRFNPIARRSKINKKVLVDNVGIKQIGNSFVYFRGAWGERQALSIPSDFNVIDELDRSKPDIVEMYEERLSASELGWELYVSTPTIPKYGISALFEETDRREWFVKCRCKEEQILSEENIMDGDFRCLKCRKVLDRAKGKWKPTRDSDIVGYHISQLMAPWISAVEIMRKKRDYKFKRDYYNFVLGEEYAGGEGLLTRGDIVACLTEGKAFEGKAVIGVDWGDTTWFVVRKPGAIVHMGKIEGDTRKHAGEVAKLMEKFNADAMCDFGYGDTKNRELMERFPRRVWTCQYSKSDDGKYATPKFDEKTRMVMIDRTRSIEESLVQIRERQVEILGNEMMETFIEHHLNLIEKKKEDEHGRVRIVIGHSGPDHLVHANNYARLLKKVAIKAGAIRSFDSLLARAGYWEDWDNGGMRDTAFMDW